MNELKEHLEEQTASDHPDIEEAVEAMQQKMDFYWEKVNLTEVLAATVLDPRSDVSILTPDAKERVLPLMRETLSMTFDHMVIQATAIASEQTNSLGRMLIHYNRSKMQALTIRASICSRSWEGSFLEHGPDENDEEWIKDEVVEDSEDEDHDCWETTDDESVPDDVFAD
ncbi:hypothetical protein RvY_16295 [Ramazzottius varieornatus]|uniref:hAT-like transposase RNase-H fold domain-containing protein n=1 Tax=Ramazzottius varieornatus TaxID=947166 RepID=A0A1D1W2D0_RAMVA|nr:hypothetical protein RvY_16295 [Ramazzottius varieornatus]